MPLAACRRICATLTAIPAPGLVALAPGCGGEPAGPESLEAWATGADPPRPEGRPTSAIGATS